MTNASHKFLPSWPAALGQAAALGAALLLAACGGPAPTPATTPPQTGNVPAEPAAAAPPSNARNVNGYKVDVANRVYQTSPARIFTGKPPPLLRSIVVVNIVIDAEGKLVSANIYRDNGDMETRAVALASLTRAAPLPRPSAAVLKGGRIEYLESWLFRNDGKFQVRSIAEVQASE
jgi:protein TonB